MSTIVIYNSKDEPEKVISTVGFKDKPIKTSVRKLIEKKSEKK